jgi:LysR family transcriptional regulator, carnitine catabolism transcriptional activator
MIDAPVRHILTLVCLADTGSFRLAAERLKLSQPAVSTHIRDLERHFGVALVHRTTRHVALTAEGQALAARARRAFHELELASQDVRDLAAVHRGRVVVTCIPPMMADIVPSVVRRLSDKFPAVELEIRDVVSKEVEQLVERGDADFGIGPEPKSRALSFNKLMRDYFVAVMPANHPLARRRSVDLGDVLKFPLLTMTSDANARLILDQAIQRLRRSITPRFELVHNFSAGRLVAVGVGVTIVPAMAIPSLGAGGITIVEVRSPRIFREIGVMSRPNYRPSPSAQAVIGMLGEAIKQKRPGESEGR